MLGTYFDKMVKGLNNNDIKLVWFDFHAECRKMKYQNLYKLLDIVKSEIEGYGHFQMSY